MKKNIAILMMCVTGLSLSSCYKKFDTTSYQPPFTINGYTSSSEIGAGSLVAYWSFDGNYTDDVSKSTGIAIGASFAPGFKGQAFQGALNGYMLTDPSAAVKNLQSFTVTEWINTPPPSVGIIGFFSLVNTTKFWGNIEMFFENGSTPTNGKVRIHVNKNGNDNTFAVDNVNGLFNAWVNISVSYDAASSLFTLFVNGSKVSSGTLTGVSGPLGFTDVGKVLFGTTQFMTTPSQTTGATSQTWASFLTGQIDEVRVYNKALTETELQALIVLQGKGK